MPENVDKAEIEKFSEFAASWWDQQGQMRVLHQINPLRLEFITKNCAIAHKKILDVGCGGGILTEALAKMGAKVTGIDLTVPLIDVAKLHMRAEKLDIHYQAISIHDFRAQAKEQFDVITCLEMLEHVPDYIDILLNIIPLLKPQGFLFISTINRNLLSFLGAIIAAEYILQFIPKGTHEYQKFIKPSEINKVLIANHLHCKDMQGIGYNPLSRNFFLTAATKINYLLCYQK